MLGYMLSEMESRTCSSLFTNDFTCKGNKKLRNYIKSFQILLKNSANVSQLPHHDIEHHHQHEADGETDGTEV